MISSSMLDSTLVVSCCAFLSQQGVEFYRLLPRFTMFFIHKMIALTSCQEGALFGFLYYYYRWAAA